MGIQLSELDLRMHDVAVEYLRKHLVMDADNVEPLIDLCWNCPEAPNTSDIQRALNTLGYPVKYLFFHDRPWETHRTGVKGIRHINNPYGEEYRKANRRWLLKVELGYPQDEKYKLIDNCWLRIGKQCHFDRGLEPDGSDAGWVRKPTRRHCRRLQGLRP